MCQWSKNGCHNSRGGQFYSNQKLSKEKNGFVLSVSNNHHKELSKSNLITKAEVSEEEITS